MPATRVLLRSCVVLLCCALVRCNTSDRAGDEEFHQFRKRHYKRVKAGSSYTSVPLLVEEDAAYWRGVGQAELAAQLAVSPVVRQAKNIVLFLGDGMSIATVSAARVLKGQRTGRWEAEELSFESFPHTALLKTYTTDSQVADSAASATAFLCGVKANLGTVGVDSGVRKENCSAQGLPQRRVPSILAWFQEAGRSSGLVTTMRVTHATPAGAYAHSADREWEDDHEVEGDGGDSDTCDDIAEQLIYGNTGRNLKVIMGGGRRNLTPRGEKDVEEDRRGRRRDGKNLIEEWRRLRQEEGRSHAYVWNRDDLLKADLSATDYLLGLFAWSHLDYALDRRPQELDPSLAEMTTAALRVLGRDPGGFFLLVEGGLIDHGHHGNKAHKALTEALELDAAVAAALSSVNLQETLVLVTADHGHSMTVNGYPGRHTDILGFADLSNIDYLPYHTLLYGNGPGYRGGGPKGRDSPSGDDTHARNYRQPAAVPESSSAHSGEDVAVWAVGPHAHLFSGTHDQVFLAHAMAYAACVGPGLTFCGPGAHGSRPRRGGRLHGEGGNSNAVGLNDLNEFNGSGGTARLNVNRTDSFNVDGEASFNVDGEASFNVDGEASFNVDGEASFNSNRSDDINSNVSLALTESLYPEAPRDPSSEGVGPVGRRRGTRIFPRTSRGRRRPIWGGGEGPVTFYVI